MTMQQVTELTSLVKDIVVAVAAASAAVAGLLGLQTWRRELKGKSEYAKAKEVLKAVYRVRYAFWDVRNPAIWQYEYPKEMCDDFGNLKKEYRREGMLQVYEKRWKVLEDAFNQLKELHLEAQVEWENFQDVIWPLLKCRSELLVAIQEHVSTRDDLGNRGGQERSKIVWRTENDEFTQKINAAVHEFEKRLWPVIKR
jgi:hypothetical protein